MAQQNYFLIYI